MEGPGEETEQELKATQEPKEAVGSLEQWKLRELRGGDGTTLDLMSEAVMTLAKVCILEGTAQRFSK